LPVVREDSCILEMFKSDKKKFIYFLKSFVLDYKIVTLIVVFKVA